MKILTLRELLIRAWWVEKYTFRRVSKRKPNNKFALNVMRATNIVKYYTVVFIVFPKTD